MMNEITEKKEKLTKKAVFTMIAEKIEKGELKVDRTDEVMEILNKEVAQLEKKRTSLTKTQKENAELVEKVYEVMAELDQAMTITDLFRLDAIQAIEGITSTNKLQALIKILKDTNRVVRTEDKKKAYFRAIVDAE